MTFFAIGIGLVLCLSLEFPVTALLKRFIKKEEPIEAKDENKNVELKPQSKLQDDPEEIDQQDVESLTRRNNFNRHK